MDITNRLPLFDSHLHIIDAYFPLIENNGFLPDEYLSEDYLQETSSYDLYGGAIVSGSFQYYDQGYLIQALNNLGEGFVGVTQLPIETTDQEILSLNELGVRAVRFNLKRGGSEDLRNLEFFAARIYELTGWHVELYLDSKDLDSLYQTIIKLPIVSIDHLGLSAQGLSTLYRLIEQGVKVKATGFSRVDFDVRMALKEIYQINEHALMFGTDLPSTRAPKRFDMSDVQILRQTFQGEALQRVACLNAIDLYKPRKILQV